MSHRVVLSLLLAPIPLTLAIAPSSVIAQQRSDCNVRVVGRTRGSQVNLRSGPGTEFSSPSYVLVGQLVNMLNDRNGDRLSRSDRSGREWYFVEYIPSRTRGWLSEQFIAPQCE